MRLKEKVAIVTGSARGLGKAMVLEMVAQGAKVVVTDVDHESCISVKEEIERRGGEAIALKCDVTSREDVSAMVEETIRAFGKIDILINNAGITRDSGFVKMTDEHWDSVMNVDLKSMFICTQEVVKHMVAQKSGRIINISSIAGVMGNFGQTNYSAAKAGAIGMTKTLSKELGRKGITVNAISPGFMLTEMAAQIPENVQQQMIAQIPMARGGKPEEVAKTAAFLASEDASYITGQNINVNGGWVN